MFLTPFGDIFAGFQTGTVAHLPCKDPVRYVEEWLGLERAAAEDCRAATAEDWALAASFYDVLPAELAPDVRLGILRQLLGGLADRRARTVRSVLRVYRRHSTYRRWVNRLSGRVLSSAAYPCGPEGPRRQWLQAVAALTTWQTSLPPAQMQYRELLVVVRIAHPPTSVRSLPVRSILVPSHIGFHTGPDTGWRFGTGDSARRICSCLPESTERAEGDHVRRYPLGEDLATSVRPPLTALEESLRRAAPVRVRNQIIPAGTIVGSLAGVSRCVLDAEPLVWPPDDVRAVSVC